MTLDTAMENAFATGAGQAKGSLITAEQAAQEAGAFNEAQMGHQIATMQGRDNGGLGRV